MNLWRADLARANLTRANLDAADVSEVNLNGANLVEATLTRTNLWGSTFWEANHTGATLTGACILRTSGLDLTREEISVTMFPHYTTPRRDQNPRWWSEGGQEKKVPRRSQEWTHRPRPESDSSDWDEMLDTRARRSRLGTKWFPLAEASPPAEATRDEQPHPKESKPGDP